MTVSIMYMKLILDYGQHHPLSNYYLASVSSSAMLLFSGREFIQGLGSVSYEVIPESTDHLRCG